MIESRRNKFIKTSISFIITFLIVIVTVIILRALTLNINSNGNPVHIFMKDYFDVMLKKTEDIASKFKIRRNSVSEYQINLVSQSVADYINLSKYQTQEAAKSFNVNKNMTSSSIEKHKENFYKMRLENPYIRGLTFFDNKGKMKLNLFSIKGFTLELTERLMNEVKEKKSMILHAENENTLYIISHIQNENGEHYVATRNDYMFVTDIVAYYQMAEKDFILTDSHNISQRIEQNDMAFVESRAKENVSSIISKYAYYKKEPAFTIGSANDLTVTMVGKNYPDYFELILISLTAFFIVLAQKLIILLISLVKRLLPIKFIEKDEINDIKTASLIDKAIAKSQQHEFAYDGPSFDDDDNINDSDHMTENRNNIETIETNAPFNNYISDSIDSNNNHIDIGIKNSPDSIEDKNEIEEIINHNEDTSIDEDVENFKVENNIETDILEDIENITVDSDIVNMETGQENIEKTSIDISDIENKENITAVVNDELDNINKTKVKKYSNDVSDIFASFDALLESIVLKAEDKAKKNISMNYSNKEIVTDENVTDKNEIK